MKKRLLQFVFSASVDSITNLCTLLGTILPKTLHTGTLKKFQFQYNPNNSETILFHTSIAQLKKFMQQDVSEKESAWYFCIQNKHTYFECIKLYHLCYITILCKEQHYQKHTATIKTFLQSDFCQQVKQNSLSDTEYEAFVQFHYETFMLKPFTQIELYEQLQYYL